MQFPSIMLAATALFGSTNGAHLPRTGATIIATLFSEPAFVGDTKAITGSYDNCHDVTTQFQSTVGSVALAWGTKNCTLFYTRGCVASHKGYTIDRNITLEHESTVLSLKCFCE